MNNIVDHLVAQLMQFQRHNNPTCWVIGLSGGVDSVVLLHSVIAANQQLAQPLPVKTLHINHQLSSNANQWAEHCCSLSNSLGVSCDVHLVSVERSGKGVESAARNARYHAFENSLNVGDILLLGHHQDDQGETVLLRLLRGAGIQGLTAMPESRSLGISQLFRPLLTIPKADIQAYARIHSLSWVDDDSNTVCDYDRNFLRHQVIPKLQERWPALHQQLEKQVDRMRQANQILRDMAVIDYERLDIKKARWGWSANYQSLATLSLARRNNVLRYWCEKVAHPLPENNHIDEINTQLFSSSALLSTACISWSSTELRQFAGRIYLMPSLTEFNHVNSDEVVNTPIDWDGQHNIDFPGCGSLLVDDVKPTLLLKKQLYQIRWRKGGERCTPSDRQHSQTLKKLLQEYQLETWLRDRVPLIFKGDQLIAVGDLWVNKHYEPTAEDATIGISWSFEENDVVLCNQ